MTTAATTDRVTLERRVPPFGGFNLTYLGIELKRKLRNRRTMIFTIAFPVIMFVIIGLPLRDQQLTAVPIALGGPSVAAYIMVSMAMYGAMMSATQTGAAVGVERAQGWSRQLRLTPLNPFVNVIIKMIAGMLMGLLAVIATYIAGAISGIQLSAVQWISTGLAGWLLAGAVFTDSRPHGRLPRARRERRPDHEPRDRAARLPRRSLLPGQHACPTSCRRSRRSPRSTASASSRALRSRARASTCSGS